MKSFFAFVVLLCFADFSYSRKPPQMKVLGIQYFTYNKDYLKGMVFYLTEHNKTSNDIHLYMKVLQDIPSDFELRFKVYATDDTFQDGELVMKNTIPICEESATRELLPRVLFVKNELLGTGKTCFPKGVYKYDTMGQLRVEYMISDIAKKGKFFRIDNTLVAGSKDIATITFYSKLYN